MGLNSLQMFLLGSILIEDDQQRYLLVQEAKDKKYSKCKDKWTLPHGSYDRLGESVSDLAIRELLEETGYKCELTGNYICVEGFSLTQNRIVLLDLIFEGKSPVKIQDFIHEEIKDIKYFSSAEIGTMFKAGQIRDNLPLNDIIESIKDKKNLIRWTLS